MLLVKPQIGNSNESQPYKGLVYSEILEIIMMLP
jgi:hypothetical protein